MNDAYGRSGVNIELGDDASKVLYNAAKLTWDNRKGKLGEVVVPFDNFSGLRYIDIGGLPKGTVMNIGFDGIGTKVEIAERLRNHETVAYDLLAMVCDDAVVRGAEPVLVGSILDVKSLGTEENPHTDFVKELAIGYINGAKQANVAIVNGEVAELGARVNGFGEFNYNWGAGVVWFGNKDRLITGYRVKAGQSIVAFRENGFRSNGLSLVRKIMEDYMGENWHEEMSSIADAILTPSQIYCAAVSEMLGGIYGEPKTDITGVAHITGGGIPGKLGRVLQPTGCGAILYNLFDPPRIMNVLKEIGLKETGPVSNKTAYKTWNMGNGMLIITTTPNEVMDIAERYGIEARVAGHTTDNPDIAIRTCDGDWI